MGLESVEEFGNRWRDRAIKAELEIERLRTMYDAVSAREYDLIEERDELRAQANLDRPAEFELRGTAEIRAEALRDAADALGRMDYDTDSNDYGYDTYRDAWNGGVMDGAALLRRLAEEQPTQDEAPRCTRCRHPKRDHDGRADHREKHSPLVTGEPWCHACNAPCDYADEAQPISEAEAAATFARECTDHAAVILWCADRVRSVDDSEAVQDAADYLHDLSTRAQVDTNSLPNRPAIIRECAQALHSMGGDYVVVRAAEYLDDLATEAKEEGSP